MTTLTIPPSFTSAVEIEGGGYPCARCGYEHQRVTQIIDATVPKHALVKWAYNCGVKGIDIEKEKEAGGDRGTELHEFLAEYITSGTMPPLTALKEGHKPYGEQLHKFLDDYDPEFLVSEVPIASHKLNYAGTLDGFAKIRRQPPRRNKPVDLTGATVLFDLKTSRDGRVYTPAHPLQLAMYEHAWQEMGGEPSKYQVVVAVGESKYQVGVSYFEPHRTTEATMDFYNMLQRMKTLKPGHQPKGE